MPYLLIAFLLTAVIIVPFLAVLGYEAYYMYRIHAGVSVGGVSLGGLTQEEARAELSREFENYAERDSTLDYQGRLWFATARELGVTYDPRATSERAYRVGREGSVSEKLQAQLEALLYGRPVTAAQSFDEGVATMYLSKLAKEINQPARDARFKVDGFQISTESGRSGLELDIAQTQNVLKAALESLSNEPLELVVRKIEPAAIDVETARQQAANILGGPLIFTLREQAVISGTMAPQWVEKRWSLGQAYLADLMVTRQTKMPDGSIALGMGLNTDKLRPYLEKLAEQVSRPARDARFDFNPDTGQLSPIVASQEGYTLDVAGTAALASEKAVTPDHIVPLVVKVTRPAVAVENTAQMGIKELVAEGTTSFKGSTAARIHNIERAASQFDGVVIAPGEVFSFNKYLGEVSAATGYEEGQIIWGDRTAVGIGGGVCQVSTTAFRTAFWAGLPILERWNHGYRVSWYEPPVGLDATVYAPQVDFKFKNDMASYILIKTETNPKAATLTFRFYGTNPGRVVEMSGPTQANMVLAGPAVYQDDPTLPSGTQKQVEWAHDGLDVTIQRTVREGKNVVLEDRFFSRYAPWPPMFLRGTKGSVRS